MLQMVNGIYSETVGPMPPVVPLAASDGCGGPEKYSEFHQFPSHSKSSVQLLRNLHVLEQTATEKISKRKVREERFAREYLLDLNSTQAAIRAGYSAKTAAQAASRMLRTVQVRGLLKHLTGRFIAPPNLRAKHQKGIPDG